jgi:hypothetical protein
MKKVARLFSTLIFPISALAQSAPIAQTEPPAVLSRGEAPAGSVAPQSSLRPFIAAAWTYDTRLPDIGSDSSSSNDGSNGIQLSGGLTGARTWKKTTLEADYLGSFEHYAKARDNDGYSHSLLATLTRELTPRSTLILRESAGVFSRSYGLPGMLLPFDSSTHFAPSTSLFDRKVAQFNTQADLVINATDRLSFSMGIDGGLTRRWSTALYGVASGGAKGDVQYRVSRRSTVGAAYNFTYFKYRGVPSDTAMHGISGTYAIRLTRRLEFSASGGVLRVDSSLRQTVALDPTLAAVLGTPAIAFATNQVTYVPNINARISRTFRRATLSASGGRTVTSGNGLFLTSVTTDVLGDYTYTGLRRWSLGIQAGYSSSKSIGHVAGTYGSLIASFSASRRLARYLHATASFEACRYDSNSFKRYNRLDYTARLGFAFAPGDSPLRVW